MFYRSSFLCILAFLGLVNSVAAATPDQIKTLASMVTDTAVPALLRKQEFVDDKYMGNTAVFVCHGLRYTLYKSGDSDTDFLSFWVRKNGTVGQDTVVSFTDEGFDGNVNFGIDEAGGRVFDEMMPNEINHVGDENREYWQQRLDEAVEALLKCKKH